MIELEIELLSVDGETSADINNDVKRKAVDLSSEGAAKSLPNHAVKQKLLCTIKEKEMECGCD